MISSQSPSSYPLPQPLDGAVISENGATKLRWGGGRGEAGRHFCQYTEGKVGEGRNVERDLSLSLFLPAIKTTRVISQ